MTIDDGVAYGEPFQTATASLRFDGTGVRLDGIDIAKGDRHDDRRRLRRLGRTYSFNVDGRRHSGRAASRLAYPSAPLSGMVDFTADGQRHVRRCRATTCASASTTSFVGDEGVGQVTGTLALRGNELSGDIDAASPRLAITGTGRIALTPQPTPS